MLSMSLNNIQEILTGGQTSTMLMPAEQ